MNWFRRHALIWVIALGGFALAVGYTLWLAKADTAAPENPFIYNI